MHKSRKRTAKKTNCTFWLWWLLKKIENLWIVPVMEKPFNVTALNKEKVTLIKKENTTLGIKIDLINTISF